MEFRICLNGYVLDTSLDVYFLYFGLRCSSVWDIFSMPVSLGMRRSGFI